MELFADVPDKAQKRRPVIASTVSAPAEDKKKNNRCRPRQHRARKEELPTRRIPSFSEFDDYSLIVEDINGPRDDGAIGNAVVNGHVQQVEEGGSKYVDLKAVVNSSEVVDEMCNLGCQHYRKRFSGGFANLSAIKQQYDDTSQIFSGLTSTPYAHSVMRMSTNMFNSMVEGTSQLQLSDAYASGEICMCWWYTVSQKKMLTETLPYPNQFLQVLLCWLEYEISNKYI